MRIIPPAAFDARRGGLLACLALLSTCGGPTRYPVRAAPRDWSAHPAIVTRDAPVDAPVYAVSDAHGGYARLAAILARHGVIAAVPVEPGDAQWAAGHAVLVVAGDMIDKGPSSLEVLEFVRALEADAPASGGAVIATLGNHEAEFLADPLNDKADADDGVDPELRARHIDPMSLADGSDPRGQWLRDRPFGARVGPWFFSHAGNTGGRTLVALESALRAGVAANDYADPAIIGDDSILEARDWWTASTDVVTANARALGVAHFVFGHTPTALGPRGAIAVAAQGALFRIDCGMSPAVDDSTGALLRIRVEGGRDVVESLTVDGATRLVWRSAALAMDRSAFGKAPRAS